MTIKTCFAIGVLFLLGASVASGAKPSIEEHLSEGTYRGTPWLSGGVGKGERDYIRQEYADDFNLKLEFAVTQGSYLGDVQVRITKPDGEVVVNAFSDGPWFMTRLPAGTYDVRVQAFDESFERRVSVPASGLNTVVFSAWTKREVADDTPGPTY